ncbi:MAG: hypothetical protein RL071_2793 [Pseudomonadota bacterium]|jgi:hypothetical protein
MRPNALDRRLAHTPAPARTRALTVLSAGLVRFAWVLGCAALAAALLDPAPSQAGEKAPAPLSEEDKQRLAAEHDRIADEIKRLIERGIWDGVERKYRDLERLGVDLSEKDYLNGAYAARELGDVASTHDRLWLALKASKREPKEVVEWLWDIDNHYGRVELLSIPPRGSVLEVSEMPMDPYQRKAVEEAIKKVSRDGIFRGMLPAGRYTFTSQEFTVQAGITHRIEVSARARRHGLVEPVIIRPDDAGAAASSGTTTPPNPPPADDGSAPKGE